MRTKLILLVDDDTRVLCAEHRLLRQMRPNDSIVCAFDGVSALDLIDRSLPLSPVDLVISDWEMPRMAGHDLARSVRNRHALLPFVLVSGNPRFRNVEDCGASALLEKPFTGEELRVTLATLLDGYAPAMRPA